MEEIWRNSKNLERKSFLERPCRIKISFLRDPLMYSWWWCCPGIHGEVYRGITILPWPWPERESEREIVGSTCEGSGLCNVRDWCTECWYCDKIKTSLENFSRLNVYFWPETWTGWSVLWSWRALIPLLERLHSPSSPLVFYPSSPFRIGFVCVLNPVTFCCFFLSVVTNSSNCLCSCSNRASSQARSTRKNIYSFSNHH